VAPGHLRPQDDLNDLKFSTWFGVSTDIDTLYDELQDSASACVEGKKPESVTIITVSDAIKEFSQNIRERWSP